MENPTSHPILIAAAGPDCGRALADLRAMRCPAVLGRSVRADIRLADRRLEPHHLLVDPGGDIRVLTATARRTAAGSIAAGDSVLTLIAAEGAQRDSQGPVVVRQPRRIPPVEPVGPLLDPGDTGDAVRHLPSAGGVGIGPAGPIAALTGVLAAGIVAAITQNAMFILFALVGVVTSLSVSGVELVRLRRSRRERLVADTARRTRIMAAIAASVGSVTAADRDRWPLDLVARARSERLWERRPGHHDATRVVIGIADLPAPVDLTAVAPADRPVVSPVIADRSLTIDLEPGAVCVIAAGDPAGVTVAHGLVRSMVAQLIVHLGPADLTIVEGAGDIDDVGGVAQRVIVLDDPASLSDVTSGVRRQLDTDRPPVVIAIAGPGSTTPATATIVIDVDHCGSGRLRAEVGGDAAPVAFRVAGITTATADAVRGAVAPLTDPEQPPVSERGLPATVDLTDIDDVADVADVAGPGDGDRSAARAVIGVSADGVVAIDLVGDGPHMLIAGTTGSGKSELLGTLAVSLARHHAPDDVHLLLVDHKGGAGLAHLGHLPHVVGVVTDLDGDRLDRTLLSLEAELRRREEVLAGLGARDLRDAGRSARELGDPARVVPARLVVIVDELAALIAGRRDAAVLLTDIAQRGRSLGVHLVLATQRPTGIVPDALAANIDVRLALRVRDTADSTDIIGDPAAARIERALPGRAVLRLAGEPTIPVQTARCSTADIDVAVRRWAGSPGVTAPWPNALPDHLPADHHAEPHHHGLIDRPDRLDQPPLEWAPCQGPLALVGPVASGTTTALIAVAGRQCDTQVYVLDARGDRRLDELAACPHVAPVVRIDDTERVGRLLAHVCAEIDARRRVGGTDALGYVLLAIDGVDEVRRSLETAPGRVADLLDRIIAEGPGVGVVTVTAGSHPVPVRHRMIEWTFTGRPGRIELTDTDGARAVAQIARPSSTARPPVGRAAPAPTPIGVLPELIDPVGFPSGGSRRDGAVDLRIGIDSSTLRPHALAVPDGEHVLVLGPARSGRSHTLDVLATAWLDAHGDAGTMTRVRGSLDEVPVVDGPHLVVVDDAARVDDPAGAFAARLEQGEPGLAVIAAVHGDALRARFGHWTQVVRRSRRGLIMSSASDTDGDLLGASLPPRPQVAARPGLAWWVADGAFGQVQVLAPSPTTVRLR